MDEVEVIVDIRPSPTRPEFVVVKRKLAAEGGKLRVVGEPVEARVGMPPRQANDEEQVQVSRWAAGLMDSLPEPERLRVLEGVHSLRGLAPARWPREKVTPLPSEPPSYLLAVPPDLRVFVRPLEDGRLEVFDVVREDTLRQFMESYNGEGPRG
jgi:hypothetical protein